MSIDGISEHRSDFKEPQRRSRRQVFYLLNAVVFFAGIALRLALAGRTGFLAETARELGSFIAVTVVVGLIYERIVRSDERALLLSDLNDLLDRRLRAATHGPVIYENGRPSLAQKLQCIRSAKFEVIELGISLRSFVSYFDSRPAAEFRQPIRELLRSGVKVKCLLMDPDWSFVREIEGSSLSDRIRSSLTQLRQLNDEFRSDGVSIDVFLYRSAPNFAAICVDGDTDNGQMLLAPYLTGMKKAESPCFLISQKANPVMFQKFWQSIKNQLEGAAPLVPPEQPPTQQTA